MEDRKIYEDIALRTEGDIYIGVVGPVRTGKSTFIKRFMETLVIPNIENVYRRERTRDELPQSGSGRTIMTAEPKFVPEEAVSVSVDGGASFQMRMIDCVGYMVDGAVGQLEGENERMVTTPWFDHEIPMAEAAEIGTRKVISEHSTIAVVVTTDGTITDIPREEYLEAEERVITELKELGKPFVVLLNSAAPDSERARAIRGDIAQRYDVTCVAVNCLELDQEEINTILKDVLYEFPLKELDLFLPPWVDALPQEHPIKAALYEAIRAGTEELHRIRDVERAVAAFQTCEVVSGTRVTGIDLGTGVSTAALELPRALFYQTLSQQSGFQIGDDGDLMALLTELAGVKHAYDKVADALQQVEETGYGIVVPLHRLPGAGGARDRQTGRTVRRAAEGQRPVYPYDPGGHRDGGVPHRGGREAERGHDPLSAPGVRGGLQQDLGGQHLWKIPPRAGQRGPERQDQADAEEHAI